MKQVIKAHIAQGQACPTLELCSANLEWLSLPVEQISPLRGLGWKDLKAFEIDADGS